MIGTMSSPSIEDVLAARARLGECPVWDPGRQQLLWVDIYNHRVHQFEPSTGRDRYVETDDVVCAIALAAGGRLLAALRRELVFLDPASDRIEPRSRIEFSHADTRFNDGKCDTHGRFWVGSISDEPGQAGLYRYDPDGSLHQLEHGLTISNGLGWSPDDRTFYLTDSPQKKIFAYRFDAARGTISDRRVLVDLGDEAVEPDGLAVDGQGNLWSALWDGWCIVCFDPAGTELERIPVPVQRPTSVAFGGRDLTELYVTTASIGLSQKEVQRGVLAGDLFRVAAPVAGLPTNGFGARS
jgi:sugar lactone lactonase YvrE